MCDNGETGRAATTSLAVGGRFWRLCAISLLLAPVPYSILLTVRWTDHWEGFLGSLLMSPLWAVAWGMTILPYCLAVRLLFHLFGWRRHFAKIVLGPSVALVVFQAVITALYPPTAESEFRRFARIELPGDAAGVRYRFVGGNIVPYRLVFHFRTRPEEIDRLVSDMDLAPWVPAEGEEPFSPLAGCPDYRAWQGARAYRRNDGDYERILVADGERTQAYVAILECN